MAVTPGTRFGSYEIVEQLGSGGMGEVYRASDTKLGREVAIKTLPAALAADQDRLARFEREAKLLAALNHPNIAAVYGLDDHDGTLYIAMELVEGETLEDRLKSGALPIDDALQLALQIAEALEAAHGNGVIHRDLKPANVMLTADGIVKVLDFGLAKAFSDDAGKATAEHSPALSLAMTQAGLVLGTAGYMSPEQASGQAADQRADIWAFGVVLYEMLTGLPLFSGESVPHVLADVLKTEPDWSRLPADLNPRIRLMLERCLTKKPRNRYHAIADARVDIQDVLRDPNGAVPRDTGPVAVRSRPLWRRAIWPAATLIAGAAIAGILALTLMPPKPITEYVIPLPEGSRDFGFGTSIAPSPSGDEIAFVTDVGLWIRESAAREPRIKVETQSRLGGVVYSPDGDWLAYIDDGTLWKVARAGSSPDVVASRVGRPIGLTWTDDDSIWFARDASVFSVPAEGGGPDEIVTAESGSFAFPFPLPGGRHVLVENSVEADGEDGREYEVAVLDVTTGEVEGLFSGMSPRYVATGHIVYYDSDAGDLLARAFDPKTREFDNPVTVEEGVRLDSHAISAAGTLVYLDGTGRNSFEELVGFLARFDPATDSIERLDAGPRNYGSLSPSPNGERVALEVRGENGVDIWIYELDGDSEATPLTLDGDSGQPSWWDNDAILFISGRNGEGAVFSQRIDGGQADQLTFPEEGIRHRDPIRTPDGRLAYRVASDDDSRRGIYVQDVPASDSEVLIAGPSVDSLDFSADGDAMAYVDRVGERRAVFVLPYRPASDETALRASDETPLPVSEPGVVADRPVWSKNPGNPRLNYRLLPSNDIESVIVDFARRRISDRDYLRINERESDSFLSMASIPGTDEFLVTVTQERTDDEAQAPEPRIIVIENWTEKLEELAPTGWKWW